VGSLNRWTSKGPRGVNHGKMKRKERTKGVFCCGPCCRDVKKATSKHLSAKEGRPRNLNTKVRKRDDKLLGEKTLQARANLPTPCTKKSASYLLSWRGLPTQKEED